MLVTVITTDLKKDRIVPKDLEADVSVPNDRMIVRITTPELKKFRLDSKKVDADIVDEGYRIIVSPTDSQHILNHNRNLYPGVGTIITIDAFNHFYCMEALVVGAKKKRYKLICYPFV